MYCTIKAIRSYLPLAVDGKTALDLANDSNRNRTNEKNFPVGYVFPKIFDCRRCLCVNKQYGFNITSLMSRNLHASNDNYHPEHSNVLPAFIRRFAQADKENKTEKVVWGVGTSSREFLHADDVANAVNYFRHNHNEPKAINIRRAKKNTIKASAKKIATVGGGRGQIKLNVPAPDGIYGKRMGLIQVHHLGYPPQLPHAEGLKRTRQEYSVQ